MEDEILENTSELSDIVYDFVLNFGNLADKKKGKYKMSVRETFDSLSATMKSYIQRDLCKDDSSDSPSEAVVLIETNRISSYKKIH